VIGPNQPLSHLQKHNRADEDLLREALADPASGPGRRAASELLARYRQQVYQWCFRYAGTHESAMDMAQDAMLRAYQKLETFEGRARFSSWLFAVTRSTCLNAVAKVRFDRDGEFDMEAVADGGSLPDAVVEAVEDRERMLDVIRRVLDSEEQEAVVLRYFEQMSPDEITRIMGLTSKSGARGLLQRARRRLRSALENPPGEERQ
jgi:RNA polymerase sigma-70 factor (ECF subfamily)